MLNLIQARAEQEVIIDFTAPASAEDSGLLRSSAEMVRQPGSTIIIRACLQAIFAHENVARG